LRREEAILLHHASIGVKNLKHSKTFYDEIFKALGIPELSADPSSVGYGDADGSFWVLASKAPVAAHGESGLHFCFRASSRAQVDAFHAAATTHGGRDNGKAGLRSDYGPRYYAAFVLDPDGYRLEAYYGGER
jgi:catechol 2,3-dioxygenase-like lactoylglutathione lyase family enzyme